MSDPLSDFDPAPVLPLEYAQRDGEALRFVLRAVAFLFVLNQLYSLCHYASDVGCYFWEQSDVSVQRKTLRADPLVIESPSLLVSLYLLIQSPGMLMLSQSGKRWLRRGTIIKMIVAPLTSLGFAVDAVISRKVFFYGNAYGTSNMAYHAMAAFFGVVEYVVFYKIFATAGD